MEKIKITALPDEQLLHGMEKSNTINSQMIKIGAVIIIFLGIISGFFLSKSNKPTPQNLSSDKSNTTSPKKSIGVTDTKLFPDVAEGTLENGGLNGEGTHHLVRPGGENQTVYLTSSVLDMNDYDGKKVKVWGKTFAAKKAGWLMDVGRLEVLE